MGDKPFILAVDLGTSGAKVALVSVSGQVMDWAFQEVPLLLTPDGGAEQDPEAWWQAIVAAAHTPATATPEIHFFMRAKFTRTPAGHALNLGT